MTTVKSTADLAAAAAAAATSREQTAQERVAQLRRGVLTGRGPGAGTSEFLAHTRARDAVGGRSVAALREQVARDTAIARRDPDALVLRVAGDRARLAGDLDLVLAAAGRRTSRRRAAGGLRGLLVRTGGVLLVVVLALRRRRAR